MEEQEHSAAAENLRRRDRFRYALVLEGVVIGFVTGVLISVFRLMLLAADGLRNRLVEYANGGGVPALAAALVLIAIAALVTVLLRAEPDIAGSGIPQVEAELKGRKDMRWGRVILCKMTGCALAIGGGLALGREGPSIQLGAMVGKGFARANHRLLTEERLLITCGAGAGLSAAFGAPLAGAIFSLEELHRNFSAEVLLSTMAASAASDFVAANIMGLTPVFGFDVSHGLPLRLYWAVLILGVLLGFFGILYNRTIAFMQDLFDRAGRAFAGAAGRVLGKRVHSATDPARRTGFARNAGTFGKLALVFTAAYLLIFLYPEALGSGSGLVGEICTGAAPGAASSGALTGAGTTAASGVSAGSQVTPGTALIGLLVLLAIKFVYSTASFGSGSPGGIFLPLLVLGAVTGGAFSRFLGLFGLSQEYITAFVVIAMAGFFAAIVRAPVTGVVLITEMTGDFTTLLPLVLVSLVAYLIAERLGAEPIYTQLLRRSENTFAARRTTLLRDRKTIIDADIHIGSEMDGKRVMDFGLPVGTLIVSVMRDGIEIIPDGHTILRGGDNLEILLRERDIEDVESILEARCHTIGAGDAGDR